jgi:N-acetyl-gamma-glutamylphosphate reductase
LTRTGATGYIGGDALYALLDAHPELEADVTCLVRNSDRGAVVVKQYPKVSDLEVKVCGYSEVLMPDVLNANVIKSIVDPV